MQGYRLFWRESTSPLWIKDGDGKALSKHVARAASLDCFFSLNVYPNWDEEPSYYDLGFDFDNGYDIKSSAGDAYSLGEWLAQKAIPFRAFFSGRKGFHIVVPYQAAGLPPRADGGHIMRLFCQHLTDELDLKTMDNTIHGKKRMWRIPNTINSKSGLYKVEMSLESIGDTLAEGMEHVEFLAKIPRPVTKLIDLPVHAELNEMLQPFVVKADAENAVREARVREQQDIGFKSLPVCITGILNDPAKVVRQATTWGKLVPSRNNLTYIAAAFFKTHRGYLEDEASDVLGPAWQKKVAAISSSGPTTIARSTLTTIKAVYSGSDQFSCGFAISRGCSCWAGCPLYKKPPQETNDSRETATDRPGPEPNGTTRELDQT